MEALPVLPSLPELLTLLIPIPLLPTCSFFVSIHILHKIHTCLICLIETAHPASDTRYMWLFCQKCHCSGVTSGHHFLITDTGFLASCRFQLLLGKVVLCALWRVLHAAVSKGWVPHTCPWELGADTAADPFQSQTYSTGIPDNLIQEVDLPHLCMR